MGKFDGVLLASDYDGTFAIGHDVAADNLEMLDYFKKEGGRFTIATGRPLQTFRPVRPLVPFNAPVILSNGAMIYDFDRDEPLFRRQLPDVARADMLLMSRLHPELSLESYYGNNHIYAWNPNPYVLAHLEYTPCASSLCPVEEMPQPWEKAIMEHDHDILVLYQAELLERWGDRYEVFFSAEHLLEITAKGCTKGAGVLRLADMLGLRRENIYCVGDDQNDLSMLEVSAIPFAPENATPEVKAFPGVQILPRCDSGAIAALIRRLDRIY